MWGCPQYRVYSARKDGEASLAHAQSAKEVAVAESRAKMEAASYESMADTIRAHGIARSNEIIGKSLSPEYLNWLWIENVSKQDNRSYIYVPSGNLGLPIQESMRLAPKTVIQQQDK